eukprot:COSAG02_NODE_27728_length_603_cov_3.134921_1_plen_70_part_10
MGAAAGTLHKVLKLPVVYLGDCTHIDPQTLGRHRTSADLARRLLAHLPLPHSRMIHLPEPRSSTYRHFLR